jgi:2,3-bisphosphoglycerate-dependent phosphoglycerate mutase
MFTESGPTPFYTFTFLRHGESIGNAEGKHQGQADFELTERGRAQAHALAERWQAGKQHFDAAVSSPLMRARETAEIVCNLLKVSLEFNALWMERDNGLLAGLHPDEASILLPRPPFVYPYLPIGETGESQWELFLRAGQAVQSLFNYPPGSYLIVSHGGILNMVFYAILGIAPHANFLGPRFRFHNTAFATLTYTPGEHKWAVLGVNDHLHWPDMEE